MRGAIAKRIEAAMDVGAAASFAAAVGFAVYHAADRLTDGPGRVATGVISALVVFPLGLALLHRFGHAPRRFPQPLLELGAVTLTRGELMLIDADRLNPVEWRGEEEPLVLDDVLVGVGADARVVRLFDAAAMPTPGQLKDRIDRHLDGGTSHSPSPDASQALYEALDDLRRSLR